MNKSMSVSIQELLALFNRRRVNFNANTKRAAFLRSGGFCEDKGCGALLQKYRIEYDHHIPDWLGGKATVDNCKVLCKSCHRAKYPKDAADIARARRLQAKIINAVTEKRKIPSRPTANPEQLAPTKLSLPARRPIYVNDLGKI